MVLMLSMPRCKVVHCSRMEDGSSAKPDKTVQC